MAERPVFVPLFDGAAFVARRDVSFKWFPGLSLQQARKSIASLHEATRAGLDVERVLEISSKSEDPQGVALSAFNLELEGAGNGSWFSVECAFQSSKVFERGGPYEDLRGASSREAKSDPRLQDSGPLLGFRYFDQDWPLQPRTAFYDWLYLRALQRNRDLAEHVLGHDAFSDIAFNPQRSLNCQARAAALYVSLVHRRVDIERLLGDRPAYLASMQADAAARGEP